MLVVVLLQTDAAKNRKTVLRLPVDSDILTIILDYAYTDCVPQLTTTGRNFSAPILGSITSIVERLRLLYFSELHQIFQEAENCDLFHIWHFCKKPE